VHSLFKTYAVEAEETYDFSGENPQPMEGGVSPLETLQEELSFDFDLAEALLECPSQAHPRDQHHDAGPDWYEDTSETHELQAPRSTVATDAWAIYVEQIRHHGRFFSAAAKEYLDVLFVPLLTGELHGGAPPVVTIGTPDSAIQTIRTVARHQVTPRRRHD